MPTEPTTAFESLMEQLWALLELATETAIAANAADQLEQVALLCERAAQIARAADKIHSP